MTAIITGATGFLGSALAARLASQGLHTVCPVRATSPRLARLASVDGLDVVKLDSFDAAELRRVLPPSVEVVFHLAAAGVSPAERDPDRLNRGNAHLLLSVLDAVADRAPQRFVHVGSAAEYAPGAPPHLIDEAHPLGPRSRYGTAKATAFTQGQERARELGINFITIRPFSVYGPGDDPERLVPHLCARLLRREACSLTPGEQLRDFTYVDDVAEALELAGRDPRISPGVYNVCSGVPRAVRDVARRVAAATGQSETLLGLGARPYPTDEAMWLVGDPTRFRTATGWRPRTDIDEGIGRVLASFSRPAPAGA